TSLYQLRDHHLPRLVFGRGALQTVRYFPDKLPIGVRPGGIGHVFLYLVTREVPSDFRLFLHRHRELFCTLYEWTIRILVPKRFRKAVALYRYAIRDELATPLTTQQVNELEWFFRAAQGDTTCPCPSPRLDVPTAAKKYGSARFRALHRTWLRDGDEAF